jgi:glycosidase
VYIAGYLNHLLDLGVAGVRIDAAKHINPAELRAILDKVSLPYCIVAPRQQTNWPNCALLLLMV